MEGVFIILSFSCFFLPGQKSVSSECVHSLGLHGWTVQRNYAGVGEKLEGGWIGGIGAHVPKNPWHPLHPSPRLVLRLWT